MAFRDVWGNYSGRLRSLAARPSARLLMENFASLSAVQVLTYLFPLITTPYLTRTLGAERFGVAASAASFVGLFIYLTNYGFGISATRQISVYRNNLEKLSVVAGAVLFLKMALLFVGFSIMALIVATVPKLQHEAGLYFLMFGTVVGEMLYPLWLFQGLEKMKAISVLNAIGKALTFMLILLLISRPDDYLIYAVILSGVQTIIGISSLTVARKIGIRFSFPSWAAALEQLREGWITFICSIAVSFYTQSRLFIFSLFAANNIVGYYAFADKAAGIIQIFPIWTLLTATLPRLIHTYSLHPERSKELFTKFQRFTVIYLLLALPLFGIFAGLIITAISGHNYPESVISLRILLVAVFFACANAFRVNYFIAEGRYGIFTLIHLFGSLAGVSLMMVIVPLYSYIGMAVSAAFTEALIFAITSWKLRNNIVKPQAG